MQGSQEMPFDVFPLSEYGLTEQDVLASLQPQIPVVCAWHEKYIEGSTSTICPVCKFLFLLSQMYQKRKAKS